MLNDIKSRSHIDMSSSSDSKLSNVKIIKSSNCVINIDYVVQEEKIRFEVFRTSVGSNCWYHRKFSLHQSKSCCELSSADKLQLKSSKMNQEEGKEYVVSAYLTTDNLGPPPFCRNKKTTECPVKDIPIPHDVSYKDSYEVSSFKFPENIDIVKVENSNFCCLDFDGTRSSKRNFAINRTKNTKNIKHVRSDIDIKKQIRSISPSPLIPISPSPFRGRENVQPVYEVNNNSEGYSENKIEFNIDIAEGTKKKKKHRLVENPSYNTINLRKKSRAAFEFILAPKDETTEKKNNHANDKNKHRKIIVTSNTLEPSSQKPNMKDEEQQTNASDFKRLNNFSVNELYIKSNFINPSTVNSIASGDLNRKRRRKNKMTISVFPVMNITGSQHDVEIPIINVVSKRPTMPRRKINAGASSVIENHQTEMQSAKSYEGEVDSIASKRKKRQVEEYTPVESIREDARALKEKVENLFKDKNLDYNKRIDYLCTLINNVVKERERSPSRSRSRTPPKIQKETSSKISQPLSRQNSFKEPTKIQSNISKYDRLKITHNQKETIPEEIPDHKEDAPKQNVVPRNVLQVSSRANEILHSKENNRKNSMATFPDCIMPDPIYLEQVAKCLKVTPPTAESAIMSNKLPQPTIKQKELPKKTADANRNRSSVTFSSKNAVIVDYSQCLNDDLKLKNTLFSINNNSLKRSKTLPTKQDFCAPSTVASSHGCCIPSSISNSDICYNAGNKRQQSRKPDGKTKSVEKSKTAKPGDIQNRTFLSTRKKQQSKNSSFQKRKEYYTNLKQKMKNKPEPDLNKNVDESNLLSTVSSQDKIIKDNIESNHEIKLNETPRHTSKSRIPLLKQPSRNKISSNAFILKTEKESDTLFSYEFCTQEPNEEENELKTRSLLTCPLETLSSSTRSQKKVSSHKSVELKEQISTLLQSYPLEINSLSPFVPKTGSKSKYPPQSLKVSKIIDTAFNFSKKNNVSSTIAGTLSSIFKFEPSKEKLEFDDTGKFTACHEIQPKKPKIKSKPRPRKYSYAPNIELNPRRLSGKTITLYRSPQSSISIKPSNQPKIPKSKLVYRSKQINESNNQFVHYSTKPNKHKYNNKECSKKHNEENDSAKLVDYKHQFEDDGPCGHFCSLNSQAENSFRSPIVEIKKSITGSPVNIENRPRTTQQINENNSQFIYHASQYVDNRYIGDQQPPVLFDLNKVCNYCCCLQHRSTREESDFVLPKDIDVIERPRIQPNIIRPSPVGTPGYSPGYQSTTIRPSGENSRPVNKPTKIYPSTANRPVTKTEVRPVTHGHPLWHLLPHNELTTRISTEDNEDNFQSSKYIPLKNKQKQTGEKTVHVDKIAESTSNISVVPENNDSFKINLDSLLLLPIESEKKNSARKETQVTVVLKKNSIASDFVSKYSELDVVKFEFESKYSDLGLVKSDFDFKYSELGLDCKTSSSNYNDGEKCSSNINVKKSLSHKYLRLLKINSLTNFLRKQTVAFKKNFSKKNK